MMGAEDTNHGYEAMLRQDTRTLQSAESRLTVTGPLRKKCGPVLFTRIRANGERIGTNEVTRINTNKATRINNSIRTSWSPIRINSR